VVPAVTRSDEKFVCGEADTLNRRVWPLSDRRVRGHSRNTGLDDDSDAGTKAAVQLKPPMRLAQDPKQPPLLVAHSFRSSAHTSPIQVEGQSHSKRSGRSLQVAPWRQGIDAHSLISESQNGPLYGVTHARK
jgi:hypothetical protein